MSTPTQVVDLHLRLDNDLASEKGHRFTTGALASMFTAQDHDGTPAAWAKDAARRKYTAEATAKAEMALLHMRSLLRGAYNYHVSDDMTDLVVHTGNQLADEARWQRRFLPTEVGFAYFSKPIRVMDVAGREAKVHAYLWGPAMTDDGTSGTAVYQFNDINDPDEVVADILATAEVDMDYVRSFGRLQLWHVSMIVDGETMGPPELEIPDNYLFVIRERGYVPSRVTNSTRYFAAFIRLLNQTIVQVSETKADRPAVKRATRRNIPALVSTIQLRRVEYKGDTHSETSVDWQARWLVRGHNAWRHCGENHPLAEPDGEGGWRCFIYIAPFIKGPPDKPLRLTEHVYNLSR